MPRFPAAFSRRKSTADNLDNAPLAGQTSSFRVLDRSEVTTPGSRGTDSSYRPVTHSQTMPSALPLDRASIDDNLFADSHPDRDSASSNNTKAASNDDSSRHSNASTAASSADHGAQKHQKYPSEDWRHAAGKRAYQDVPLPPVPKSNTTGSFLKNAGRTFSFGGNKKPLPLFSGTEDRPPATPPTVAGRERATTASTVTTATPPRLEEDFTLDLGGDFGNMLSSFDKRASTVTVTPRNGAAADSASGRQALAPRSLTGSRLNQPSAIQVNNSAKVDPSPYSWSSQTSNNQLLYSDSPTMSPTNENAPPVPRHAPSNLRDDQAQATSPGVAATNSIPSRHPPAPLQSSDSGLRRSSALTGRRRSTLEYAPEAEDEDTVLLKDSLSIAARFLSGGNNKGNSNAAGSGNGSGNGSGSGSGATSLSSAIKSSPIGRFRRTDDSASTGYRQVPTESTSPVFPTKFNGTTDEDDDGDLFDVTPSLANKSNSLAPPRHVPARKTTPPQNKVMTPAEFERYRNDKEREDSQKKMADSVTPLQVKAVAADSDNESDADSYEDDVDELERSKQAAKQRRKQEAHMTVYRQQMMKVTGEAASGTPTRGTFSLSMSTPNLHSLTALRSGASPQPGSDGEDEDEEIPLAILAAHGFPAKNRPPTRLTSMMSNPNLRAAAAPSFQRPGSAMGETAAAAAGGSRLPVFARNLPQDPYGLVNSSVRETINMSGGGGAPGSVAGGSLPPGGLVGVIATEERNRAMRRGSPAMDATHKPLPHMGHNNAFDPMASINPHTMYPGMAALQQPMLTPGDQAQIQMTQQMQQFMQMQMQFMQMMASGNGAGMNGMQRPMSQYSQQGGNPMGMGGMGGMGAMNGMNGMAGMNGMGMLPEIARGSFMDNGSTLDAPGGDVHNMRTMSLVQPSSASWVQQPRIKPAGYAPSIRIQGANGYAPSIAPSERSNVGLPGRYRPVSQMPAAAANTAQSGDLRKSTLGSSALNPNSTAARGSPTLSDTSNSAGGAGPTNSPVGWDQARKQKNRSPLNKASNADEEEEEDEEQGWAAMKAKREKKRSMWRSKKSIPAEIGALIS